MEHFIFEDYKRQYDMNHRLYEMYSQNAKGRVVCGLYSGTYLGYGFEDAISGCLCDDVDANNLVHWLKTNYQQDHTYGNALFALIHYVYLFNEWKKKKQIFKFDRALTQELADTEVDFVIPFDIFSRLPYQTLYMDFSDNPEICEATHMDGCIVQPHKIVNRLSEGHSGLSALRHDVAYGDSYFVLLIMTYYKGRSKAVRGLTFPNTSEGISLSADKMNIAISESQTIAGDAKLQTAVIMQALLYLCSYEPDIRETDVSKAQRRQAKQNKTKSADMPIQSYVVGVRFGAAFRKWTAGTLGAEHSTGTGSHKRPHMRRAHWHRFWTGKRDSDDRKLIIKWVSECFCGVAEGESDKMSAVQHKVS